MQEFDVYLKERYDFVINDLKGKALNPWQVSLLKRLNPSNYDINTMIEEKEYDAWLEWFSSVKLYIKNYNDNTIQSDKSNTNS